MTCPNRSERIAALMNSVKNILRKIISFIHLWEKFHKFPNSKHFEIHSDVFKLKVLRFFFYNLKISQNDVIFVWRQ